MKECPLVISVISAVQFKGMPNSGLIQYEIIIPRYMVLDEAFSILICMDGGVRVARFAGSETDLHTFRRNQQDLFHMKRTDFQNNHSPK
jgi:hypothetical protein